MLGSFFYVQSLNRERDKMGLVIVTQANRKCVVVFRFGRIGVLCAYAANQNLSAQVKNIRRLVNSNMRDLHTFANDTPMVGSQIWSFFSFSQRFFKMIATA